MQQSVTKSVTCYTFCYTFCCTLLHCCCFGVALVPSVIPRTVPFLLLTSLLPHHASPSASHPPSLLPQPQPRASHPLYPPLIRFSSSSSSPSSIPSPTNILRVLSSALPQRSAQSVAPAPPPFEHFELAPMPVGAGTVAAGDAAGCRAHLGRKGG
eukprot:5971541-Pyramimonas_sp.AAC.1